MRLPTVDVFRPIWSVVGVEQLTADDLWIFQAPIPDGTGTRPGGGLADVCGRGSGAARLSALPLARLLLIGIAAPASELGGATEVVSDESYEGLALPVREVRLDPDPGAPQKAAVRLFAQPDLEPWPDGAYRFDTADIGDAPRFLRLCLTTDRWGPVLGQPALTPI